MKKLTLVSIVLLLSALVFGQAKWELIYEQEGNGGLMYNNLSSSGVENDVFASGREKNSFTAPHVSKISQWSQDQKWAQGDLSLAINAKESPKDVFVLNENNIWVCGYKGMISYNKHRGIEKCWKVQPTPANDLFLESIWFTDENNGWAVGRLAAILFTKDGGNTWKKYPAPVDMFFSRVMFTDSRNGYILGMQMGSDYYGTVLKTTDGGASWKVCKFKNSSNSSTITDMYFYDSQNGWICGDGGFITHTSDGGRTWKRQQWYIDGNHNLNDIHFVSLNEGWACGVKGLLYHTTNGGKNWAKVDVGETREFTAIEFNGPYLGWLATSRKIYEFRDPRFKNYRQDYLKNGSTNPSPSHQPAPLLAPRTKPAPVIVGASTVVAFTSVQKGTGWEIRSYQNNVNELNKAFKQIQKEGSMPVGLNLANNKMEIFVINSRPFKSSEWILKKYSSIDNLSSGITQMIESGYLPFGMALENNNFNILFAKTSYIGHGWQIVESELDHQDVANDIQPHLEEGFIPVGISLFSGYFYTLLIHPDQFPVTNYTIQGYDASQPAQLKNGISGENNNGSLPQGYFKQEGIINILFNRF